jgi:hypothetical protein
MLKTRPETKSVFGNRDICYFGYDKLSAGRNMAIDEVLLGRADTEEKFFLRFYDVERPSVILSRNDHYSVIKEEAEDFDVCRRISGGGPIYLDGNTFQYSITGPLRAGNPLNKNRLWPAEEIHRNLGPMLADAINDIVGGTQEMVLGRTSSVRVWNRPVAAHGHSVRPNHSFLYHGVIVVYPWDVKRIGRLLNMTDADYHEISTLPNIKELAVDGSGQVPYKDLLRSGLLGKFPKEKLCNISQVERDTILNDSELLYQDYCRNKEWIYNEDGKLIRNSRFCILFNDQPRTERPETRDVPDGS